MIAARRRRSGLAARGARNSRAAFIASVFCTIRGHRRPSLPAFLRRTAAAWLHRRPELGRGRPRICVAYRAVSQLWQLSWRSPSLTPSCAAGAAAGRAAQQATSTVPLFTFTDDMLGSGLVASLARPGGNMTGISILATELDGKRQELLMEMVPTAQRMGVLADANTAASHNIQALQEASRARGVELSIYMVERVERIVPEIELAGIWCGSAGDQCAGFSDLPFAAVRYFRAHERVAPASYLPGTGISRRGWNLSATVRA